MALPVHYDALRYPYTEVKHLDAYAVFRKDGQPAVTLVHHHNILPADKSNAYDCLDFARSLAIASEPPARTSRSCRKS